MEKMCIYLANSSVDYISFFSPRYFSIFLNTTRYTYCVLETFGNRMLHVVTRITVGIRCSMPKSAKRV